MKIFRKFARAAVLLPLIAVLPAAADAAAPVLWRGSEQLANGGFDEWAEDRPVGWTVHVGATEGEGPLSSLAPNEDDPAAGRWLVLSGSGATKQWQAAIQTIDVRPGDIFRFSGRLRSTGVDRGSHRYGNSQAAIIAKSNDGRRVNSWVLGPAVGTTEWSSHEIYIQAPQGSATFDVAAFLSMNGTLEIDDLSLERIEIPAPDPNASREDRWSTDISLVSGLLPRLHVKPFTMIAEAEFQSRAADLEEAAGELSDLEITLRLAALVAALGDAHTSVQWAERPERLPIRFAFFGEDLRVLAVDHRCAALAGGRVTRIGSMDIGACLAAVRPLIACETQSWFRRQAPQLLSLADVLYGTGLTESRERTNITVVAEDGEEKTCVIALPEGDETVEFESREPGGENRPLYMSNRANYWFQYLEDERTLYLQYNRCVEDASRPMAEFTKEVAAALDAYPVDRFVLDLRFNSGGSSTLLSDLIREAAERRGAGKIGRCYVITGPATFSAACLNALDFRRATEARVVGEPMGNKPNRFGELNYFALPNSGLRVQYATKHFVTMEGDPPILEPDLPAELTWEDYMAGRDPALARILSD